MQGQHGKVFISVKARLADDFITIPGVHQKMHWVGPFFRIFAAHLKGVTEAQTIRTSKKNKQVFLHMLTAILENFYTISSSAASLARLYGKITLYPSSHF